MKKTFLLEQCNRGKAQTEDELRLHISDNNTWWINHQEVHIKFITELEEVLINQNSTIDKKELRKWMSKRRKISNDILNKIEKKTNNFEHWYSVIH